MKTITEFAAPTLKNAAKVRTELVGAGKTPEELPAALGEALKIEGDKLKFLLNALESLGTKTGDLKRIVVFTAAEGEKLPPGAQKHGEENYLAEYYPPLAAKNTGARGRRDDPRDKKRGDKRGGRGDKRGGGKSAGGGRDSGRGPSGPGRDANRGGDNRPNPAPRGPRPAPVAAGPKRPLVLPKPNVIPAKAPAPSESSPATETPPAGSPASEQKE